jgi:hypothetical protein
MTESEYWDYLQRISLEVEDAIAIFDTLPPLLNWDGKVWLRLSRNGQRTNEKKWEFFPPSSSVEP